GVRFLGLTSRQPSEQCNETSDQHRGDHGTTHDESPFGLRCVAISVVHHTRRAWCSAQGQRHDSLVLPSKSRLIMLDQSCCAMWSSDTVDSAVRTGAATVVSPGDSKRGCPAAHPKGAAKEGGSRRGS